MKQQKSKKIALAAVGILAISTILGACGNDNNNNAASSPSASAPAASTSAAPSASAPAAAADRTVTDGLGHEVTVPANPQRVIASYLEDNLVALGVTPVAQWSVSNGIQDYLQGSLKDVPTISYDLPYEEVASFTPDLIIVGSATTVEGDKYDSYSKIAPTYVVGDEANNNWRDSLLAVGKVLGKDAEAQKALDDYDAKAKDAKEKLQAAVGGQSAAALWLVGKSFFLVGQDLSAGAVLYGDLGLTPPSLVAELSSSAASWNAVSLEKLATLDADHLFLINSDGEASEELKSAIWQNLPAVKNGHVYEFAANTSWLYSGPIANGQIIDNVLDSLAK
ncbi:iron-hydroxamate ABC transporter substrate-binding protein [Cohnella fermenti]|uniref:Iron-hydroxamate ABC transporter substrate-binding protein n=1 Tax=Cohnella fermenti TaxID=2565925 RepID=A0A4V3WGK1_9BACL|nr:iron-hydroxamate ABC transporter substrate-binding protein [Cohnella fermenti]THF84596.1 iron-hydroxamate ABC transporter substrate-binding protein [Cohnella fermenti]